MSQLPFRAARCCGGSMSSPECTARMVITTTQELNSLTASPAFKKWERRKHMSQLKAQEGDMKAAIVLLLLVFCSGAILGYLTGSATKVDKPPPPTVLPEKSPECPMPISGARNSSHEVAVLKNRLKTEQQEHQAVFSELEHMLEKMGSKMSSMEQDCERSKSVWMYGSCILMTGLVGVCMYLMLYIRNLKHQIAEVRTLQLSEAATQLEECESANAELQVQLERLGDAQALNERLQSERDDLERIQQHNRLLEQALAELPNAKADREDLQAAVKRVRALQLQNSKLEKVASLLPDLQQRNAQLMDELPDVRRLERENKLLQAVCGELEELQATNCVLCEQQQELDYLKRVTTAREAEIQIAKKATVERLEQVQTVESEIRALNETAATLPSLVKEKQGLIRKVEAVRKVTALKAEAEEKLLEAGAELVGKIERVGVLRRQARRQKRKLARGSRTYSKLQKDIADLATTAVQNETAKSVSTQTDGLGNVNAVVNNPENSGTTNAANDFPDGRCVNAHIPQENGDVLPLDNKENNAAKAAEPYEAFNENLQVHKDSEVRNLKTAQSEQGSASKQPNGICKEPTNCQEAFVDAEIHLPAKMENKDLAVHESPVTASKLVKQAIHTLLEDTDCNGLDSPAVADSIVSNSVCYGRVLLALGDGAEDERVPTAIYRGCMR